MNHISCFLSFLIFLLPLVTGADVMRAVERFRNDVNWINPFYRLTTNIYHWNYKFSQPERKKWEMNFPSKQIQSNRQRFAKRPPLLKPLQRARNKIPVKKANNNEKVVTASARPSNHRPIIAQSEQNNSESEKLINDENCILEQKSPKSKGSLVYSQPHVNKMSIESDQCSSHILTS